MDSRYIINQLSYFTDKLLATSLIEEYKAVKKELWSRDWSNCLIHCGLFAEIVMATIKCIYDRKQVNSNKIHFEQIYQELIGRSKNNPEDEILLLAVPNAAKTIYTIRSKKKAAHIKAIDPDFLDSTISSAICDWILSQIILLKCGSNANEVAEFIHSIIDKKIPLIEEFEDGSLLVLHKDMTFKDELLLILYQTNKRIQRNELKEMVKVEYGQKLSTTLANMKSEKLVHENDDGVKITFLGIQNAEQILLDNLNF